jgi:DNA-binding CsgD family transcriptional regulator
MSATNTSADDDYKLRFVTAYGTPIAAQLSSAPFLDSAGDVQGTVLTLIEVPLPIAAPGSPVHQSELASAGHSEHSKWSQLTQRERAIVEMLIAGERVPAIAKMLFVSNSTVRSQLSSVFHKLGVASQQELIHLLR